MNDEPTFAECRRLLQQYVNILASRDPAFDAVLMSEAKIRLEQLDYLLEQVHSLERSEIHVDRPIQVTMLVRLYAECFYYLAARFVSLCRKNAQLGLSAFKCRAVVDVRGDVIEHPENSGRHVVSWSWGHDDGRGPVFEGRSSRVRDAGLFRNADDMRARLRQTIEAAIQKKGGA